MINPNIQLGACLTVFDETSGELVTREVATREVDGRLYPTLGGLASAYGLSYLVEEEPGAPMQLDCGLTIWPDQWRVTIRDGEIDKEVELAKMEYDILKLLVDKPDIVHTREQLATFLWGDAAEHYNAGNLNVHIRRLRNSLAAQTGRNPDPELTVNAGLIKTIRGVGYQLGERAYDSTPLVFPSKTTSLLTDS